MGVMKALHVGLRPVLVVFCALWLSTIHTQAAEEKTEAMLLLERLAEKLEPMVLTNTGIRLTNRAIKLWEMSTSRLPVPNIGLGVPAPRPVEPEPPMPSEWREVLSYDFPTARGTGSLRIVVCKSKGKAEDQASDRRMRSSVGAGLVKGIGDRAFQPVSGNPENAGTIFFSRGVVYVEMNVGKAKPALSMAKSVDELIREFFKPAK